ncbi:MAG: C40 family peptidase [Bacteroidetes bacterium]|nr:C40 family peptidase [Bacteroidota bacterium]
MPIIHHYAVCSVSIAPLRESPAHTSEQVSQILFGERLAVLQFIEQSGWAKIRMAWDGYEGWCKMSQLQTISPAQFRKKNHIIASSHQGHLRLEHQQIWLPAGSELDCLKKAKELPANSLFQGKYKGKKEQLEKIESSAASFVTNAQSFLNAPYHWGGRSAAGIDCSGLVQMALKLCGKKYPRDASEQALLGEDFHFLQEAQAGDLAFFDNELGKITHVGILLSSDTILHATDSAGRVVVDKIDPAGIISTSLKMRTHQLRTLRRIRF